MKAKFREILTRVNETIFRYPMVLLMAMLASAGAICMFENNHAKESFFIYSKFTICTCLGISLMFALKMLSQRIGKSLLLEIAGIAFLIIFYFVLPAQQKDFTEVYGYMIAVTLLLSHLLVSFIPFLSRDKELNFWQYNKNLFINIFLTGIFTGVLTGGVELAILAVDKLFDLNLGDRSYTDTFYVLAIFGSSFIFSLFNENGLSHLEKDGNYPVILKFFTQFILIPLLIIYAIILYFYSFRILISWQLPRGWVSYLVLAYSIVGIMALLLVYPLKGQNTKSWVKIFSKVFYYTAIPLIILLFTAIFTRILAYGYTEPRYFVLLLALWLLNIVIYFMFNRKASLRFIPVSLFLFGLFSLIFPYFNAFSVANRSQKSELIKLLDEKQLLDNGKINFQKKVTDTVADEVADKFHFLSERKQYKFLFGLIEAGKQEKIAQSLKSDEPSDLRYNVLRAFTNISRTSSPKYEIMTLESEKKTVDIEGYEYLIMFRNYANEERKINDDRLKIIEDDKNTVLKIMLNSKEEADFTPAIQKLFRDNGNKAGYMKVPEISWEKDLGKYHLKIFFPYISMDKNPYNKSGIVTYDNAILMIREK
ncbi:DUF4153 domain-containing protein [Chryseobacterium gossypii]|uniref:DUF4153 domain-containing protein n=1 Tax=Chryseobacterium gossypii TaxID=3231602 RepID=UPI0035269830